MPKVATPKSSPVKRQQTAGGSSPAKSGSPRKQKKAVQVQDRSQWRLSRIPENTDINKSAAVANYHLNINDLQGLSYKTASTAIKINGVDKIRPMYLYKEREVELKAWEKHGGPEGFEKLLNDKMAKFYAKHGTRSGKLFPKPTTYNLPNDPMDRGYVCISSFPKHLPDIETSTPTLIQIKEQMEARGEKWLWDALNKHLFDVECRTEYGPTLKRADREALMLLACKTMRDYPKRPTSPPPSDSASFKALKDLLDRAGSVRDELMPFADEEVVEVYEDPFTGDISVSWFHSYMNEVKECLDDVVKEHGMDGWKRARWLVYDKYIECNIGGPEHERVDGRQRGLHTRGEWVWYDSAKFWLHERED